MYYLFYNDTIFKDITTIYDVDKSYPACVYDRTIGNYFHKNVEINDTRNKRLSYNGLENTGKISLFFDASKHDEPIFTKVSKEQLDVLFSIIEFIVLTKNKTNDEINAELMENNDTSELYIDGSLKVSLAAKIETTIIKINDEDENNYSISLPTYFQFSVRFSGDEENTDFRIYLGREYFLRNYPLSTINNVIEPCDHSYLLNPDKATSIVDMLVKSNEFTLEAMGSPVASEDHSGLYVYKTKFIVNGSIVMLPFGILYQGTKPSALEIRKAIREKLLSYGSADEEIWKNILPDLFVVATWYIVPFWSNETVKTTGVIYPSVGNMYRLTNLIPSIFPNLDVEFIEQYEEILVCGYNELFFAAIPDPMNENLFSIREMYPTYQYHLAQDGTGYNNMDENAKEFNNSFNNCVAVAMGETTSESVTTNTIDDKLWFNFTSGEAEFNLLSKGSFKEITKG